MKKNNHLNVGIDHDLSLSFLDIELALFFEQPKEQYRWLTIPLPFSSFEVKSHEGNLSKFHQTLIILKVPCYIFIQRNLDLNPNIDIFSKPLISDSNCYSYTLIKWIPKEISVKSHLALLKCPSPKIVKDYIENKIFDSVYYVSYDSIQQIQPLTLFPKLSKGKMRTRSSTMSNSRVRSASLSLSGLVSEENVTKAYNSLSKDNKFRWFITVPKFSNNNIHLFLIMESFDSFSILRSSIPLESVAFIFLRIPFGKKRIHYKNLLIIWQPDNATNDIHTLSTFQVESMYSVHFSLKIRYLDEISLEYILFSFSKVINQLDEIMLRVQWHNNKESKQLGTTNLSDKHQVFLLWVDVNDSLQSLQEEIHNSLDIPIDQQQLVKVIMPYAHGEIYEREIISGQDKNIVEDLRLCHGDKIYVEFKNQNVLPFNSRSLAEEREIELEMGIKIDEKESVENEVEIDLNEVYIVKSCVGRGKSAEVHKAIWRCAEVALKQLKYHTLSETVKKTFFQEVQLLRHLKHPNIVRLVGACSNPDSLSLLMEWLPRGSLHDLLQNKSIHFSHFDVLRMSLDIAKGCQYLHNKGIIHRDLKSHNLLVDEQFRVKIADFGISRLLLDQQHASTTVGTIGWVAPEVLMQGPSGYTQSVDVFSFGIVLWEIVTRSNENPVINAPVKYYNDLERGIRPPLNEEIPIEFQEIIQKCWKFLPEERVDFDYIVKELENQITTQKKIDDNL